jgi:hypothetical protein
MSCRVGCGYSHHRRTPGTCSQALLPVCRKGNGRFEIAHAAACSRSRAREKVCLRHYAAYKQVKFLCGLINKAERRCVICPTSSNGTLRAPNKNGLANPKPNKPRIATFNPRALRPTRKRFSTRGATVPARELDRSKTLAVLTT